MPHVHSVDNIIRHDNLLTTTNKNDILNTSENKKESRYSKICLSVISMVNSMEWLDDKMKFLIP